MALDRLGSNAIADLAVSAADIAAGTITTAQIANDAITTAKIADTVNLGRRNIIINGAFNIAQRGTSSTTGLYQTVDRWKLNYGGGGTLTQSQHTLSSSDTPYTLGFRKSYHATVTSASNAAGTFSQLEQHIEAQNIARSGWNYTDPNSKLTLSYWVKSSLAGTYYSQFRTVDGTSYYYNKAFTLAANTWTKVTCTVPGNSNLQIDDNTDHGFTVVICPDYGTTYTGHSEAVTDAWYTRTQTAGYFPNFAQDWSNTAGATFEITGVQLEVGDTATPFEHLTSSEDLAICQRYFYNPMSGGNGQAAQTNLTANVNFGTVVAGTNVGHFAFHVPFPVTMRTIPTLTHNISNSNFSGGSAPSGSQVEFYYQNQGYTDQAGNGNLNTLARHAHSNSGCMVGTYYISPSTVRHDQFIIGASLQFHFSADI